MSELYFAYGSNMPKRRLENRIGHVHKLGIAELEGYKLICNKISIDGSSKFNIQKTENLSDKVFGVLYKIEDSQLDPLDAAEGAKSGGGYRQETVEINYNEECKRAITYICTESKKICDPTKVHPYDWYVYHAVIGACEAGLPYDYIKKNILIDATEDKKKKDEELRIYL